MAAAKPAHALDHKPLPVSSGRRIALRMDDPPSDEE
jgi:hypothetical protein